MPLTREVWQLYQPKIYFSIFIFLANMSEKETVKTFTMNI